MRTLKNIKSHTNKLQKLIEYSIDYHNGDLNMFQNGYNSFLTSSSTDEIIKSFDKDLIKTASTLFDVQELIASTENGIIKEFNKENNRIEDVFGELYNKEKNSVKLNGIIFSLDNPKIMTKNEIKEILIEREFGIEFKEYKSILKSLKILYGNIDGMEKLSMVASQLKAEKLLNIISEKLNVFKEFRQSLSNDDRILIDKGITFSRTMIDGVIQDSTYISKKDGIEQIARTHKEEEDKLNTIYTLIKEGSYIGAIELDKDSDLDKIIDTIKQIEDFNLAIKKEFIFKVRKLGNYNAQGLYINAFNIVAVDVENPSALIHELTHMIDYEKGLNFEGRDEIVSKYTDKINHYDIKHKSSYYLSDKEVIARLAEIAYMFEMENRENKHSDSIEIVEDYDSYKRNKNIYFNFDTFSDSDKEEIKDFFHTFFRLDKEQNIAQNFNIPKFEKLNKKRGSNNNNFYSSWTAEKKKLSKIFSNFNRDNILEILKYNDKEKVIPPRNIISNIMKHMFYVGEHKKRMDSKEWSDMMLDRRYVLNAIIEYAIENNETIVALKHVDRLTVDSYKIKERPTHSMKKFWEEVSNNIKNSEQRFNSNGENINSLYNDYKDLKSELIEKLTLTSDKVELDKFCNENFNYDEFSSKLVLEYSVLQKKIKEIINKNNENNPL